MFFLTYRCSGCRAGRVSEKSPAQENRTKKWTPPLGSVLCSPWQGRSLIAIDRITFSDTDLWFGTMCQGSVNAVEQFAIVQRLLENDPKAGSGCTMVEVVADL